MEKGISKRKVLFICTHNSARSQMAEGYLRELYGDRYEALSAGTNPTSVHPYAVLVMAEEGIDISRNRAKNVTDFLGQEIDEVVTVCDQAQESCPYFPHGKKHFHQSFPDPSSFQGSEKEKLVFFLQVRDQIRAWVVSRYGPREEPSSLTERSEKG